MTDYPFPPPPPPPPVALTLVSALYEDPPGVAVQLTFDRAIDIAGVDAAVFFVDDGEFSGVLYQGASGEMLGPQTLRVMLAGVGASSVAGVVMNVGAGNGVVAVDDGGTWDGIGPASLPWP